MYEVLFILSSPLKVIVAIVKIILEIINSVTIGFCLISILTDRKQEQHPCSKKNMATRIYPWGTPTFNMTIPGNS